MTWISTASGRTLMRLVVSAGVVAIAATLVGLSTWASFTDSTSATHSVSTGSVDVELGVAGTAANRLDIAVGTMAPGDTAQRALNLRNPGTLALASATLTTAATTSSVLDTNTTNGLKVAIDRCSVAWTETPVAGGGYTYTCSGTTTTVLATRAIVMTTQALSSIVLTAGGTTYLRVTTSLPATADNTFQGTSSTFSYTFRGVQRTATNR